jgi:hypothetical protein
VLGLNNYKELEFYLRSAATYEKTIYRIYIFIQHIPGKGTGKMAAKIY